MIAAVATIRQDADIAAESLAHLRVNGIEHIYVAVGPSSDSTREVCREYAVIIDDPSEVHYQPRWINQLARHAAEHGADWILPFDADEFPYATNGGTIREALEGCAAQKLYMRRWRHHDRWRRWIEPERLHKVAYRWQPLVGVENGNHETTLPGGEFGVLDMREIPYRSFEQFKAKVAARNLSLDPAARERGDGSHHTKLDGLDEAALRAEYDTLLAIPSIHDPIPTP